MELQAGGYAPLAEVHAYFDTQDNPIPLERQTSLTGTVTVQECEHKGVKATPNNDGTHSLKCPYCGYTGTVENCSYGEYTIDGDETHSRTCTVCGYEQTKAHELTIYDGKTVGLVTTCTKSCQQCKYTQDIGTLTQSASVVKVTYGQITGDVSISENMSGDAFCTYSWSCNGTKLGSNHAQTIPTDLPAGRSTMLCLVNVNESGQIPYSQTFTFYIEVAPAPLTGDMVTLSSENATYNGTEQKPTITVKQGDTTLTAGTDYDIIYSTTDFTNAGTVKITVTGTGNYEGTVEKSYTIAQAPLTIRANDQIITYGQNIAQGAGQVTTGALCGSDTLERVTLTASSDQVSVAGKTITPSGAVIQNASNEDVTRNYSIKYETGSLTINKSTPTIAFIGGYAPNKTYDGQTIGDPEEKDLEITGATYGNVTFQWSATPKDAGTYTLTATIPETTNTAKAEATLTVTISRKQIAPTVTITPGSYEYTGQQIKPGEDANTTVIVMDGNDVIPASEYTLSYATIAAATAGDAEAIASVLEHYRSYITYLSRRLFFDEYGACYVFPDDTMARRLETKLTAAILKFSVI